MPCSNLTLPHELILNFILPHLDRAAVAWLGQTSKQWRKIAHARLEEIGYPTVTYFNAAYFRSEALAKIRPWQPLTDEHYTQAVASNLASFLVISPTTKLSYVHATCRAAEQQGSRDHFSVFQLFNQLTVSQNRLTPYCIGSIAARQGDANFLAWLIEHQLVHSAIWLVSPIIAGDSPACAALLKTNFDIDMLKGDGIYSPGPRNIATAAVFFQHWTPNLIAAAEHATNTNLLSPDRLSQLLSLAVVQGSDAAVHALLDRSDAIDLSLGPGDYIGLTTFAAIQRIYLRYGDNPVVASGTQRRLQACMRDWSYVPVQIDFAIALGADVRFECILNWLKSKVLEPATLAHLVTVGRRHCRRGHVVFRDALVTESLCRTNPLLKRQQLRDKATALGHRYTQ